MWYLLTLTSIPPKKIDAVSYYALSCHYLKKKVAFSFYLRKKT